MRPESIDTSTFAIPVPPSHANPLTVIGCPRAIFCPRTSEVISELTTIVVIGSFASLSCDAKLGVLNLPRGSRYAVLIQKLPSGLDETLMLVSFLTQ